MRKISTFQSRLKEGLALRSMKASELSKATGISKALISYYLKGQHNPNANNIYDIAHVLGVNEAWLMGYDVSPSGAATNTPLDNELEAAKISLKKKIDGIEDIDKVKQIDDFTTFIIKK